jgi:predicted short-subunit dehydrogenase-like oxidoreductase (DUF2520 family)
MPDPVKIVFIGAGNVATHLSRVLFNSGYVISQIISKTKLTAQTLATEFNSDYSTDPSDIRTDCDIIFISVGDQQIEDVLSRIKTNNKLIVHTSGTLEMKILSTASENFGVFYPLQTFTKNTAVDFSDIPLIIEANSEKNLDFLKRIASDISNDIRVIDSEKRKIIHLAAVIVNNFTNLNYTIAQHLLEENNISFDVLKPLILETAKKAIKEKPSDIQTGPAYREDSETILKHIEMLSGNDKYRNIYEVMTSAIAHHKKENEKL